MIRLLLDKLRLKIENKQHLSVFATSAFLATLLLPGRVHAACVDGFGPGGAIPTWYKYLPRDGDCTIGFVWPEGLALIGAALVELLFVIGGMVAVLFIIVGGFQLIISRGEPDKIAGGRRTVINALIGLVITIMSVAIVRMVAGAF
jgi:hypothetical protein